MSGWAARRFWKETAVIPAPGGWTVALDGRPLRTPAKNALLSPTEALAEAIAAEWDAQSEKIDPASMPATRTLNTAIDRVAAAREAVIDDIAGYGGADLICYRALEPEGLVARQSTAWDPLLEWSRDALDAPLIATTGIMHIEQPTRSLEKLHDQVAVFGDAGLAALYDLTAISGSVVIALAIARGHLTVEGAWAAARIDDDWQVEQWGHDSDAEKAARQKERDFSHAARMLTLLKATSPSG